MRKLEILFGVALLASFGMFLQTEEVRVHTPHYRVLRNITQEDIKYFEQHPDIFESYELGMCTNRY